MPFRSKRKINMYVLLGMGIWLARPCWKDMRTLPLTAQKSYRACPLTVNQRVTDLLQVRVHGGLAPRPTCCGALQRVKQHAMSAIQLIERHNHSIGHGSAQHYQISNMEDAFGCCGALSGPGMKDVSYHISPKPQLQKRNPEVARCQLLAVVQMARLE